MGQKVKRCKLIGLKLNNDKVHDKYKSFNIAVKTKQTSSNMNLHGQTKQLDDKRQV